LSASGPTAFVESFPFIATPACHTLILGSMPGVVSLAHQQYYAHPRNTFWPIASELLGIDGDSDYALRTQMLATAGFGLWDVLQACIRPGSLDASIDTASIVPNDIAAFIAKHPALRRICFNGATAARLFRRHVQPGLAPQAQPIEYLALPSTSPAHAAMRHAEKLRLWRALLQ
jgi:hypoxanthine-DNA glycosylase